MFFFHSHWMTNSYALFGAPYFFYDAWAMYTASWHRTEAFHTMTAVQSVKAFVSSHKLMMCHHIVLPVIYLPIIVVRNVAFVVDGCTILSRGGMIHRWIAFTTTKNIKNNNYYIIILYTILCSKFYFAMICKLNNTTQ